MANSSKIKKVVVGSRKSELAMIQTNTVIEQLQKHFPKVDFEIVSMETIGDFVQDKPLANIGQSNLFTKELEKALATSKVDMLVHSMKDLPSNLPEGMVIAAVYKRDDPFDAIVLHSKHKGRTLQTLPEGSVLGTSSVRRVAMLKNAHPHLKFEDVRGNLNTRLRKLDEGKIYDGLILAKAGMERMGWDHRISQVLDGPSDMYAVSQGALGVEVLESNSGLIEMLSALHDRDTVLQCVSERALLRTLEGGCSAPVAVKTEVTKDKLKLHACTLSLDGSKRVSGSKEVSFTPDSSPKVSASKEESLTPDSSPKVSDAKEASLTPDSSPKDSDKTVFSSVVAPNISGFNLEEAEEIGVSLAKELLNRGADAILREAKEEIAKRRP